MHVVGQGRRFDGHDPRDDRGGKRAEARRRCTGRRAARGVGRGKASAFVVPSAAATSARPPAGAARAAQEVARLHARQVGVNDEQNGPVVQRPERVGDGLALATARIVDHLDADLCGQRARLQRASGGVTRKRPADGVALAASTSESIA